MVKKTGPLQCNAYLTSLYLFKVNNKSTRKRRKIYSLFTIKTPERYQWRHTGVFIVKFEYISYLFPVFLLLMSNM